MLPAMIPILVMVMMPPSKVSPVVVVRALLPAVTMIIVMGTVAIIVIVSGIVDTLAGTILRFVQNIPLARVKSAIPGKSLLQLLYPAMITAQLPALFPGKAAILPSVADSLLLPLLTTVNPIGNTLLPVTLFPSKAITAILPSSCPLAELPALLRIRVPSVTSTVTPIIITRHRHARLSQGDY